MSTRPIASILNEARALLRDAESSMGGMWRTQVDGWVKDASDWTTSHPEGELTEMQLDPGVEARLSKLELALTQLALSLMSLQTLALQGVSAQQSTSRWQMAQDLDPEGEVELLNGEKVKIKDVPIDPETGQPEEEWAMEHCPCSTHEEKRSRKAAAEQQTKGTGLYL